MAFVAETSFLVRKMLLFKKYIVYTHTDALYCG